MAWDILILKKYWLLIWNSSLTGYPAFLFAKSGDPACPCWTVCPWVTGFASQRCSFLICGVRMGLIGRDRSPKTLGPSFLYTCFPHPPFFPHAEWHDSSRSLGVHHIPFDTLSLSQLIDLTSVPGAGPVSSPLYRCKVVSGELEFLSLHLAPDPTTQVCLTLEDKASWEV